MKKAISIRTALGLSVTLGLALAMPAWAKGKHGGSSTACTTTNVTSVLNDSDGTNLFQILSDQQGPYTTITASQGRLKYSVKSIIAGNCFWTLDTTASTSRGIELNLAYDLGTPAPAGLAGTVDVHGRLVTHCSANTANNGLDIGTMTAAGQTAVCPINLGFYAPDGTWYNLAMNPNNWDGTTQMKVTCDAASGGACDQWTIVPDPATAVLNNQTNQHSAIGELILPPCVGCSGGTPLGLFEVSFNFLVHK